MKTYTALRGRVISKVGTARILAEKMGISEGALSLKLNGKRDFSTKDIRKIVEILELTPDEISLYFFSEEC